MDPQKIYIIGETSLVNEYAELCARNGHSVAYQYTKDELHSPGIKQKNIIRANTPTKNTAIALELTNCDQVQKKKNIQMLDKLLLPSTALLCSTITTTATECAHWLKKTRVCIGISAFPTLISNKLIELSIPAHHTDKGIPEIQAFFASLGKESAIVDDRIGMVLPRILAQIINEAMIVSTQQLALPATIDTAMKLGADYPHGPIEWLGTITAPQVVAVLDALHHDTGDERYAAVPLLRKMAAAGEFWKKV
jgi:3-hydroxybutyryl-CoA dehydrogenase